jgi:DNA polymerase-3 subunit delta
MALGQLQKVHQARLRVDSGLSAADAVRAMRPPVFFRAVSATTACVSLWSSEALLRTIEEARQVEMACKQTGARQELLARRFVAGLARQAQARRRG